MANVTLRQLRYFDALARCRHFGRAAEQCAVSQPALSMQIQELEREVGTPLVERTRHGVQLTEAGREIARRAGRILAECRDLLDWAQHNGRLLSGILRLGVIPSVAPYLLPPLLPLLRSEYPNLELHLRETQTQQLTKELLEGKLDVLLLALPVDHPDVESIRLVEDRFLLALPASRKVGRVLATPDLLRRDRLLLLEEGHCLREQALSYCRLQQVESVNTFGASSLSTIVQMVANGHGITLLPELSLDLEARNEAVRLMRFAEPQPHRVLGLVWRRTSPRKRDFVEFGKSVIAVCEQKKRERKAPAPPARALEPDGQPA
ncbi:MAG TPA: LysR substrate-binding domain-containing protein [Hyphomicrobiaceae bacterium]|nr:LysR substrate-binding domain-containing protein [Hyphomicrobiaceae bacterium]